MENTNDTDCCKLDCNNLEKDEKPVSLEGGKTRGKFLLAWVNALGSLDCDEYTDSTYYYWKHKYELYI